MFIFAVDFFFVLKLALKIFQSTWTKSKINDIAVGDNVTYGYQRNKTL